MTKNNEELERVKNHSLHLLQEAEEVTERIIVVQSKLWTGSKNTNVVVGINLRANQ